MTGQPNCLIDLFNFYLKQKQKFSVWSFTENASFVSFHGKIWLINSKINKLKLRKNLYIFPKTTKSCQKNASFKENVNYKEAVCFTGYTLY